MKILFLIIGKTNNKQLQLLIDDYESRLKHYISFETKIIPELKNTRNMPVAEQKEKEAELFLKQIDTGDDVVLLDEKGKHYSSVEFAGYLENKMNIATKRMIFVVGGPFGFSPAMYERANHLLSLSKMTFSHQMVRLFFTEQLYRAMTIIRGEKYHNES